MKTCMILSAVAGLACAAVAAEPPLKALIVDGQNNHKWQETTPVLKDILTASGLFAVDVATAPAKGKPMDDFKPDFAKYNVIMSNYNGADWPAETQKAFTEYMRNGGGLVVVHAANNSFPKWKEYNEMIGLGGWGGRNEKSGPYVYWQDGQVVRDASPGSGGGHGPQYDVQIITRDAAHPVMAGLPEKWMHAKEEFYIRLRGPAENLTLLATGYADPAKKGTGRHEPALFTISYGRGRVFHTVLGHGAEQMHCVGFIVTLQRGAEWAATGKVTQKVPDDFPTAEKTSVRKEILPAAAVPAGGEAKTIEPLAGKDFSAFRGNTGDWKMVSEVFKDPSDEKKLAWKDGTGAAINGPKGRTVHLVTAAEHGDCEAHVEFVVPRSSNSGVYFMGRYEIQVFDSWGVAEPQYSDCGGIYQRWREGPGIPIEQRGYEGRPPRVNASKAPGEWQSFDVVFRAPRFDAAGKKVANAVFVKVVHNGQVIHENQEVTGPTRSAMFNDEKPLGPLMLQGDHGPVAYRNVRIVPN